MDQEQLVNHLINVSIFTELKVSVVSYTQGSVVLFSVSVTNRYGKNWVI